MYYYCHEPYAFGHKCKQVQLYLLDAEEESDAVVPDSVAEER